MNYGKHGPSYAAGFREVWVIRAPNEIIVNSGLRLELLHSFYRAGDQEE